MKALGKDENEQTEVTGSQDSVLRSEGRDWPRQGSSRGVEGVRCRGVPLL